MAPMLRRGLVLLLSSNLDPFYSSEFRAGGTQHSCSVVRLERTSAGAAAFGGRALYRSALFPVALRTFFTLSCSVFSSPTVPAEAISRPWLGSLAARLRRGGAFFCSWAAASSGSRPALLHRRIRSFDRQPGSKAAAVFSHGRVELVGIRSAADETQELSCATSLALNSTL